MAARVLLLHWNEPESGQRAQELAASGYDIDCECGEDEAVQSLRSKLPDVVSTPWRSIERAFDEACGQSGRSHDDYKVCAVAEAWSGLLFRRRR